ncbi:hypothetical protein TRVA0_002S01068 [Trichomonascus vanleenenianus]|uniref:uncharacterized protein n=1 Tax=Trichomonascus vanleenenianus TaxID=2268995 RepID=UPI003ECB35C0
MELSKPLCFAIGEGADEFVRRQVDPNGTEETYCFCSKGCFHARAYWCQYPTVLLISENHFASFVSLAIDGLPARLSRWLSRHYNWPNTKSGQATKDEFNQVVQWGAVNVTIVLSSFDGHLEFASTQRLRLILELLLHTLPRMTTIDVVYCHRTIPSINSTLTARLEKLIEKRKVQLKFTCYTPSCIDVDLPKIDYSELHIIYTGIAGYGSSQVEIPRLPKMLRKFTLRDCTIDSGGSYIAVTNWSEASLEAKCLVMVDLHLCVIRQKRHVYDRELPQSTEVLNLTLCGSEGFFTTDDIFKYSVAADSESSTDMVYIGSLAFNAERMQYFRKYLYLNPQLRSLILNNVTFESLFNLLIRLELENETIIMLPKNIERLTVTNWVMNLAHWKLILSATPDLKYLTLVLRGDQDKFEFAYIANDLSLCPTLQNVYFVVLEDENSENANNRETDPYFFHAYLHETDYWEAIDIAPDPGSQLWSFEFAQYRRDILSGQRARGPITPHDPERWSIRSLKFTFRKRYHYLKELYRVPLPWTTETQLFRGCVTTLQSETGTSALQSPEEPEIAAHLPSPASSAPSNA